MAKQTRKELLKHDDLFFQTVRRVLYWLTGHRRPVLAAGVAFVAVVVAVWWTHSWWTQRQLDSNMRLSRALEVLEARVVTDGAEAAPLGEPPTFASETQKLEAARDKLAEAVAQGRGGAAMVARLYLAHVEGQLGRVEEAEKLLVGLGREVSSEDPLFFLVVDGLAVLQEKRGARDEALATWERVAARKGAFFADYALLQQARLWREKGDTERARALLARLETEFAGSSWNEEVQRMRRQWESAPAAVVQAEGSGAAAAQQAAP